MVIEKILKVNSTDPKVEELRKRLADIQNKSKPATPVPATPAPQPTPVPTGKPPTPVAQPAPSKQDDMKQLQELSLAEQAKLLQRQNPDLRLKEERTLHLLMTQIKELINLNTESSKKVKELEGKNSQLEKELETFKDKHEELLQKMNSIDSRLEKFMGLYELITNQYNPFADNTVPQVKLPPVPTRAVPQATPPAPAPVATAPVAQAPPPVPQQAVSVKPQAGTFKVEDNLTKETATVEVREEDANAATRQFRRVEELLAELQKQEEAVQHTPSTAPPSAPPDTLLTELHQLLAGFESRLTQQFDQSLQAKLHSGFSALEQSLQAELRDALKRELEALQQDDLQVQQTLTELQELLQAAESTNRGPVEDELHELTAEIDRVRDEVKALPPNLYFRVADGTILKSLRDLGKSAQAMPQEIFQRHVGGGRHDFADWVEHALLMPQLGALLRQTTSPSVMAQVISQHDGRAKF